MYETNLFNRKEEKNTYQNKCFIKMVCIFIYGAGDYTGEADDFSRTQWEIVVEAVGFVDNWLFASYP